MKKDGPAHAMLVVVLVALVCSVMVSVAAVGLRPLQERNQLIERSRNIIALTGFGPPGSGFADDEVLAALQRIDARVVDLDTGTFALDLDAADFDPRETARDADLSTPIDPERDLAQLGKRNRFTVIHLVWDDNDLRRVILPIHGQGMWSTLYGYVALNADLNTIAAATFYEQAETAGLGDQITRQDWLAQWRGRAIYDDSNEVRFRVATGKVGDEARHEVDGLTGATVTGRAVTQLVAYWFSDHGYGALLQNLRNTAPERTPHDGESR